MIREHNWISFACQELLMQRPLVPNLSTNEAFFFDEPIEKILIKWVKQLKI